MTRTALDRLLRPHCIAVIGGGAWCASVIGSLRKMQFAGAIWHVHPSADHAYASVTDLPHAPDACFLGINRHSTLAVLADLDAMGAGGAVCFASGFAESADGTALNAQLVQAAGDMALVGPNCYGFVNALDGVALWPDVHGLVPVQSGVAILTQSSNIALNLSMQRRGLPIGVLGTAGNQAQLGLADLAQYLIADPRITALGLYIEGVGDVAALQGVAQQAARLGKRIIAMKSGRSEAAQRAAISHTASMTGSDQGADALFARLGIARVSSLDAFVEALKAAHLFGTAALGPIASLSCSGGEASLMADSADRLGIRFAPLSDAQDRALDAMLGPLVTRTNPLDYHTFIWNQPAVMAQVYATMSQEAALTVIVADFPRRDRCDTDAWDCVTEAVRHAARQTGARFAVMASIPEGLCEELATALMDDAILPISGLQAGLEALAALSALPQADPDRAMALPNLQGDPVMLDEADAKAALRGAGLDVPWGAPGTEHEQIVSSARGHYPVALKARGLAHKTDAGGVALGLADDNALRAALAAMPADAVYVEEMVTDAVAELLVSVLADPAHGYVLTLGAGGVMTELWADTQAVLVPATQAEIDQALERLRIAPLLGGFRGKAPCDRAAVIKAVMALQRYVVAQDGSVAEIEINPLIVTPTRAVVADALIRKG